MTIPNYITENKLYDLDIDDFLVDIDEGMISLLNRNNINFGDTDSLLGLGIYYMLRKDSLNDESKAFIHQLVLIEIHKIIKIKTHKKHVENLSDDFYFIGFLCFMVSNVKDEMMVEAVMEYKKTFMNGTRNLFYEHILNVLLNGDDITSIHAIVNYIKGLSSVELVTICVKYSVCRLLFGMSLDNDVVQTLRSSVLEVLECNDAYVDSLIAFDEDKYGLDGLSGLGIFLTL